jgi:hypothetical protein
MSTGTSAWAPQTGGVPPQPGPPQSQPPYGWTPPPAGGPAGPVQTAPGQPRVWLWALATAILMVVAIAATAAITYAIARSAPSSTAPSPASPAAPAFTAAEQADAKQAVCNAFDVSSKGIASQGGARVDGQPNLPMLLRTLTGTVSIQSALVPATPMDISEPARRVVATNLDLMNAALGQADIDEVQRANNASNLAVDALVSACGLPH